jgi:hypothetical protein
VYETKLNDRLCHKLDQRRSSMDRQNLLPDRSRKPLDVEADGAIVLAKIQRAWEGRLETLENATVN